MTRRALMEHADGRVGEVLASLGYLVIDEDHAPLTALRDLELVDLIVGGVRRATAEADLRHLTALHALAPETPMVVVAEALDDGAGHLLSDALLDVPIIRRGRERDLLAAAVAAAG